MSDMAIRDQSKFHARALENLQKKQRIEIDNLAKNHETNIKNTKENNNAERAALEIEHDLGLREAEARKDRVLNQMSTNLDRTRRLTDQQLKKIAESSDKQKSEIQMRLENDVARQKTDHELVLEDENLKFQSQLKNMTENFDLTDQRIKDQKRQELASTRDRLNANIDKQRTDFTEKFNKDRDLFDRVKYKQDEQFKKSLKESYSLGEKRISDMNVAHVKKVEQIDDQNTKMINDQEVLFEKKYQGLMTNQDQDIKSLKDRSNQIVNKMKQDVLNTAEIMKNRSTDPFYDFVDLKPKVTELPDAYKIEIEVPEHAKDQIHVSTNNKEIILSLSRRLQEERVEKNGHKSRVNKVESTMTNIPVSSVLNPRKQDKVYSDGVMTFKIYKA